MELLLAPMDAHRMWEAERECATAPVVRLPSLFAHATTTGGATSPLRSLGMTDVLRGSPQLRPLASQPSVARLPSIGSIMRRDTSPRLSAKSAPHHARSLSPTQKQSCVDIYRQLQPPRSPARSSSHSQSRSPPSTSAQHATGALSHLLADAALSQLAVMHKHKSMPHHHHLQHIKPMHTETHSVESSSTGVEASRRANSAKLCGMSECNKRAKAGGFCIAHGGGLRCSEDGCQKHAVSLGLCISHGGGKRCTVEGCLNASRKNGVCWSHGGKRLCKLEGCNKGPKSGGYCWSHGGKMKK